MDSSESLGLVTCFFSPFLADLETNNYADDDPQYNQNCDNDQHDFPSFQAPSLEGKVGKSRGKVGSYSITVYERQQVKKKMLKSLILIIST